MTRKTLRYYGIAFFSGSAVLIIETMGVRILAPYLGAAYVVWVNIVGVILASLAVGYWVGGRAADRTKKLLSPMFFLAAVAVSLIPLERRALPALGESFGIRYGSLLASLLLFAPASTLLGMATPYLVKLATDDPERVGESSGSVFAASTIGSIVATFATGFFLIPRFSTTQIIWGVVAMLLALALAALPRLTVGKASLALLPIAGLAAGQWASAGGGTIIYEKDSQYYNIRILRRAVFGMPAHLMLLDGSAQGAKLFSGSPNGDSLEGQPGYLLFPYVRLSAQLIDALKPAPDRLLAIGGGAYSIPEYVKVRYPASEVTVAEIDPAVTDAARRFFMGRAASQIRTLQADGRVVLNQAAGAKYDLVYTDAYNGAYSVPWHLASREALTEMRDAMRDDGVLIVNIASGLDGETSAFFRSFWKTSEGLFPQMAILATKKDDPSATQNVIVVATRSFRPDFEERLGAFERYRYRQPVAVADVPVLTDVYAPTDSLIEPLVLAYYRYLREYME
ncbi:MAG TPA: fused MFS/spermidine synthase [Anaeromyxobacteraceae bacterium]|nr:fused MFS/spermidine synthase [Anaeromyxobacteraceae bacterium]